MGQGDKSLAEWQVEFLPPFDEQILDLASLGGVNGQVFHLDAVDVAGSLLTFGVRRPDGGVEGADAFQGPYVGVQGDDGDLDWLMEAGL